MFKFLVVLCTVLSTVAFNPIGSGTISRLRMASECKAFGAALIASSMLSMPVIAAEGTAAKIDIFGNNGYSSPFSAGEKREDPLYSPYSPYGDGSASVYKKGSPEEIKFYTAKFTEGV